ncbi:hypothetical protein NHG49_28070 [Bacillus sp. IBL03825]|nr:hypothetical protein [Bacillus thuringiensis]MCR6850048.1 hypothetical protein [Bacillus sp. IBL03825]
MFQNSKSYKAYPRILLNNSYHQIHYMCCQGIVESNPTSISTKVNQVIGLIEVRMPTFRSEIETKAVKKTLTIPHLIDKIGKANNVNYSQVLQDALKKHFGITKNKYI